MKGGCSRHLNFDDIVGVIAHNVELSEIFS